MFSSAREPIFPSPQAQDRRRGGPVHIREVLPDALERALAQRGQSAETGEASDRPAVIRLPNYSNAA